LGEPEHDDPSAQQTGAITEARYLDEINAAA